MRVGGKYSKDIWFWFLSFFSALTVGRRWCMEGRLYNLPYRHPKNNSVSMSAPHLHMTVTCQAYMGSEGAWPRHNPDGVVCALAQHRLSLYQWALVVVLSL